jgi:hypothetical protein
MRTDQGRHQTDIVGIKTYGKLATSCSNTQNDIVDSKKKKIITTSLVRNMIYSNITLLRSACRVRVAG